MDEESAIGSEAISSSASTANNRASPVEEGLPARVEGGGYHKLADFMAAYPAVAIFRRFKALHVLKLLYLQAELTGLEQDLKYYAQKDAESPDTRRQKYCRNWELLHGRETDAGATDKSDKRQQTWTKISDLLKLYDDTLQNTNTLLDMPKVSRNDLKLLRGWMPNEGNVWLTGVDWDVWDNTPRDDLLALRGREYEDSVAKWVDAKAVPVFHRVFGRWFKKSVTDNSPLHGTAVYKIQDIAFVVSAIMVSLASALPILAVVVLSLQRNNHLKLGLMGLFTIVFSFILGFMSGAKKTEIFAASAAFAAVQVVFISGTAPPATN